MMDLDKKKRWYNVAGIGLVLLLLMDVVLRYKAYHNAFTIPTPTVMVTQPRLVPMSEFVMQTGNLVAFNAVNLVARVEGYLEAVQFTDGAFVKKGTPLLVIEPQPYFEKLKEAQATVAAQKANAAYTKAEYARQQRMYKENATSLNNVEKWFAKYQESEADVAKALANEAIAAINYGYTHIQAPFDGRLGRHLVDPHNLVGNGVATNLALIEQLDPIYVYFNLNELDLLKLRAAARKQGYDVKKPNQKPIPVYVNLQGETGYKHEGTLDFVNTNLNASTGTMELRGVLSNPDHHLLPGLFVQVRVPVGKPKQQLTVPDTAVLYDQIGPYLLVVNEANCVVLSRVTLGTLDEGTRAILTGLKANDKVIVGGLQNATPGNQVVPQEEKAPV